MIHLRPSTSYLVKAEQVNADLIDQAQAIDVLTFDAQVEGVKELRQRMLQASFSPLGETRLLVIANAHNLTEVMQNTLLKILEEPYPHLIILVQTPLERRLLPTVLSRLTPLGLADEPITEQAEQVDNVNELTKARDRDDLGRLLRELRTQIRSQKTGSSVERWQKLSVIERAINLTERNCNFKLIIDSLLLHWPLSSGK